MEGEEKNNPVTRRILALDVGTRRIGIALSDALGITAQPLPTLRRTKKKQDFVHLEALAKEHGVSEIVVGNPLRMSGESGTQAEKMSAFAEELRLRTGIPVVLWDERLTSAEAHRLLNETGMQRLDRKKVIDRMAALLILQSYLEAQRI